MENVIPAQAVEFWAGLVERYANAPRDYENAEAMQYATATLFRHAEDEKARRISHYLAMADEYRRLHNDGR